MIELSKNRWFHLLSVVLCLAISTVISQVGFQEDEEALQLCFEIGPFENHIDACLKNRILQLDDVAELSDQQTKRLRVAAKGVLQQVVRKEDGTFYYGNPLKSKFWLSNVNRVLDEEQLSRTEEFDAHVETQRKEALGRYGRAADQVIARAEFVGSNLQKHLYLTDKQTQQVTELLKSHLEELQDRSWDPKLDAFLEAKRPELEKVLVDTQLVFFDRKSLINGIGDRTVWDTAWQKSTCTDCHA